MRLECSCFVQKVQESQFHIKMRNIQVIVRKKENKELNNIATDNESMLERLTKYCNLLFENKLKDIKKIIQ